MCCEVAQGLCCTFMLLHTLIHCRHTESVVCSFEKLVQIQLVRKRTDVHCINKFHLQLLNILIYNFKGNSITCGTIRPDLKLKNRQQLRIKLHV
jgi:hypothetical protein